MNKNEECSVDPSAEISSDCISTHELNSTIEMSSTTVSYTKGRNPLHNSYRVTTSATSDGTFGGRTVAGELSESLLKATESISGGFQRNGNELRRSLRRINSITRRKLSPGKIMGGECRTPQHQERKLSDVDNNDDISRIVQNELRST